jgi:hypothetical protein
MIQTNRLKKDFLIPLNPGGGGGAGAPGNGGGGGTPNPGGGGGAGGGGGGGSTFSGSNNAVFIPSLFGLFCERFQKLTKLNITITVVYAVVEAVFMFLCF